MGHTRRSVGREISTQQRCLVASTALSAAAQAVLRIDTIWQCSSPGVEQTRGIAKESIELESSFRPGKKPQRRPNHRS